MQGLLNWEAIQNCLQQNMSRAVPNLASVRWGSHADMYNQMAKMETEYTAKQVAELILDKNDTVLDIGCGPGRLSVPIAKLVRSVTSLDIAKEMLERCAQNAQEAGLANVTTRLLDWNDAVIGKNIERHDVVIASRSVGMHDILKLNAAAKKHVFVLSFAQRPSLKEVRDSFFYGVSDDVTPMMPLNRMFGYNIMFNMLYDMGIDPSIRIITDGFHKDFKSREQAYDDLRTLCDFEREKEAVYRANVDKWLTEGADGGFVFRRETKTYVIHWEPIEL